MLAPTYKFRYERQILAKFGYHVGRVAVEDVNGDGWVEVFIPDNTFHRVHIYTANPAGASVPPNEDVAAEKVGLQGAGAVVHAPAPPTKSERWAALQQRLVSHATDVHAALHAKAGHGVRAVRNFLSSEGQTRRGPLKMNKVVWE